MSTSTEEAVQRLQERVDELEAENERLKDIVHARQRTNLFEADETLFEHTFRFEWPSLKNSKQLIKNKRNGRMAMRTAPEVKKAVAAIRHDLLFEMGRRELPLFPHDVDVGRAMHWDPEARTIRVAWYNLGPAGKGRRRDLVNLAALLDDAVGRERIGRTLSGPGLIYRDDAQIAESFETRRTATT